MRGKRLLGFCFLKEFTNEAIGITFAVFILYRERLHCLFVLFCFNLPVLMLLFAIMWNSSHLGFSCFMTNGWDVGNQAMSEVVLRKHFLQDVAIAVPANSSSVWVFTDIWRHQGSVMGITCPAVCLSLAMVHEKCRDWVYRLMKKVS